MKEALLSILWPIIGAAIAGILGYFGTQIKAMIKKHLQKKEAREAARDCVKAVEQMYKTIHGEEKYNKCVENLTQILNRNGIELTSLEIQMLIESAVQELNAAFKEATAE